MTIKHHAMIGTSEEKFRFLKEDRDIQRWPKTIKTHTEWFAANRPDAPIPPLSRPTYSIPASLLAEMARAKASRLAEMARAKASRLAEMARAKASRLAEQAKAEPARLAEMARAKASRLAEQAKANTLKRIAKLRAEADELEAGLTP